MNSFVVLFFAVITTAFAATSYTTKYDNVDIDEILNTKRLLINYTNCLLDKGSCSPDGAELKRIVPDALTNECASCNDIQKRGVEKVIRHLYKHNPTVWKELEAKYDSTGIYRKKYQAQLDQLN